MTGKPLPNAVIITRNVTRMNESHARNDVIKHDITSGISCRHGYNNPRYT